MVGTIIAAGISIFLVLFSLFVVIQGIIQDEKKRKIKDLKNL